MESNQAEQERKKNVIKSENRLRELTDTFKSNNIHIVGIPEERERKRYKNLSKEIKAENIPNLEN